MKLLLSGAALSLVLAAPALAQTAGQLAPAAQAPAPQAAAASDEIVVTARRLDEARESIQPQVGASTYTLSRQAIASIPGGDNAPLNQIILQAPGVTQDSFGQLHVRDDHNNLQYRLNGVILPEGLSVFGQALSPRLIDKVELITGALPAEYGLRTAGIVDITTKSGLFQNGGTASIYGGSHGEYQPSLTYGGSSGPTNVFVSASYLRDQLGIESPDGKSTPDHDRTDQLQGFAYVDHILDDSDRVSLILGASNDRFQIPNTVGLQPSLGLNVSGQTAYPSADLSGNQREATDFAIASLLHAAQQWSAQISLFARYSSLTYRPALGFGELLYNGVSQAAAKQDAAFGVQAEGAYHLGEAHTLRAGVILEGDRGTSNTLSYVLPLNAAGNQTTDVPEEIAVASAKDQFQYSVYVQDEWKIVESLTFNYGLRFDEVDAYRDEGQISPRVNLVWQPFSATTVHAGYARYFTPPPFELVGTEAVARFANTTAAPASTQDDTPRSEREDYFDLGVQQRVGRLTLGIDGYDRFSRHLIDEGQFGAPIILTPFNYRTGRIRGVELSSAYTDGPFSAYANLAWERAMGRDIESSQFNFSAGDLAYIQSNAIFLDHNQTYTASAGVSYRIDQTRLSADLIYGSGLRADLTLPDGNGIPNGRALPDYVQVNLSLLQPFDLPFAKGFEARFDVINLFDEQYEIRDGTGIGVGAPQWGPRRGFFVGLTKNF